MKEKLLVCLCFLLSISVFAKAKTNATTTPGIGIQMYSPFPGTYYINIKNISDDPLTNVYVTQSLGDFPITFSFSTIPSLAPGEELINLQAFSSAMCYDFSQVIVHATTSGGSEITDLSSDPTQYNNGELGSYYNDSYTISYFQSYADAIQEGTYQDLNNNSIVDVGDAVYYTYSVNSQILMNDAVIIDDNATVGQITYNPMGIYATGVHYITQNEANTGYVYNRSSIMYSDYCHNNNVEFVDQSQCYTCPNPNFANIITNLNNLGPHLITGNVKLNNNNDNCASGVNIPNRRVSSTGGPDTYSTFTNASGNYTIIVPNMSISHNVLANSFGNNFNSNPTSININTNSALNPIIYNNNNFCISAVNDINDLSVCMFNINHAVPGATANYKIQYSNLGTTNLNGAIQLTYDNGKLTLVNASPIQNSATGNTLTWNFSNLLPFESRFITLSFTVATPPTANINNPISFTVNGNPTVTDTNLYNNTHNWTQIIRSSYDPNDKTVIEGSIIDIGQTGNYLHYVTRFQNTGNADATTVVIKEMLDPNLDWSTFEPIASSHPVQIQLHGNDLTYTFSNINLPYESANEQASHGWMTYRIKPKSNIALWDIMSSSSNIYFDYNPPIQTNGVSTQVTALSTADFVKSNFTIYPIPTSDFIIVETKNTVDSVYEIVDINGKLLLRGTTESLQPINISNLQSGFYFLNIKTNQGKATYKIVKD